MYRRETSKNDEEMPRKKLKTNRQIGKEKDKQIKIQNFMQKNCKTGKN
jgi:hypothetical protein